MKYTGIFLMLMVATAGAAEAWKPLFNGKDLSNWNTFLAAPDAVWDVPGLKRDANGNYPGPIGVNQDPLKVFQVRTVDGGPVIYVTGQGFGTLTTKESHGNFHLRLQVKWGEKKWSYKSDAPRDCGLLYFCHGEPDFVDGTWPRSVEFQIQEHDMGDLYALYTRVAVHAGPDGRYDPKARPVVFAKDTPAGNRAVKRGDPEKPNGEWNTLDLYCFGADSMHVVNGVVVMRLHRAERADGPAPVPLTSGPIGLQTEGAEVYYRNIEITPITAMPPEFVEK